MASFTVHYEYTFTDADGHKGTVRMPSGNVVDTVTIATLNTRSTTLGTDLQALSNAKVTGRSVHVLLDKAQGVGTDAPFADIEDKASLQFANAFGSKGVFAIPAPLDAIFLAPPTDDVVNRSNALVQTLLTDMIAVGISDVGGHNLNLLISGVRRVGKFPSRQTRISP